MKAYLFPGQGSQKVGMGEGLFESFRDLVREADEVLGYSLETLCLEGPEDKLNRTDYTQPALYVVSIMAYHKALEAGSGTPDYVAGHSLGEYTALYAAGAFDFATGLRLVQKRGALMAQASGGGMAAVIGLSAEAVDSVLQQPALEGVQAANYNAPTQIVISGPAMAVQKAQKAFEDAGCQRFIPLNVSGAFHSEMMEPARKAFAAFLKECDIVGDLKIPVIANVEARRYEASRIKELLAAQITHSVQWTDSIRYLMGKGVTSFQEIGPGKVLTGLVRRIQREAKPLVVQEKEPSSSAPDPSSSVAFS